MYQDLPIQDIYAREILDSRGNPTVEVEILAGEKNSLTSTVLLAIFLSAALRTSDTVIFSSAKMSFVFW